MTKTTTQKRGFDARKLRLVLLFLMLLIVAGSAAAFTFGVNFVREYALEISAKRSAADASDSSLRSLQTTEQFLGSNQAVLDKAERLRADAKSNEKYPEIRIVDNVRRIARANGLGIESITASASAAATPQAGGAASTPPAPQPATSTPATPGAVASPTAASDTVSVSVAFTTPVDYRKFLQFLSDIEQSVPLMKVEGVDLSPSNNSSTQVSASSVTIHMYIKKGV